MIERNRGAVQEDYPWITLDDDGRPWMVFVTYDGKRDRLKIAPSTGSKLEPATTIAGPGMIHRPRIEAAGDDTLWAFWSGRNQKKTWVLKAQKMVSGDPAGDPVVLSKTGANQVFPDTARGPNGDLRVTWQAMHAGGPVVRMCRYDAVTDEWNTARTVSENGSAWRPRVAAGPGNEARIVYESAAEREFDLKMATVTPDGTVKQRALADTDHHESFAEIADTPSRKGFYVTWEEGKKNWGLASRGHHPATGINTGKYIRVGYFDSVDGSFRKLPDLHARSALLHSFRNPDVIKQQSDYVVNVPQVATDGDGAPWVFVRWAVNKKNVGWLGKNRVWHIAAFRFSPKKKRWSRPVRLKPTGFYQERLLSVERTPDGHLFLAWPSDKRVRPETTDAGVFLQRLNTDRDLTCPDEKNLYTDLPRKRPEIRPSGPVRQRTNDYEIETDGTKRTLYWGDVHRHTDLPPIARSGTARPPSTTATDTTWPDTISWRPRITPTRGQTSFPIIRTSGGRPRRSRIISPLPARFSGCTDTSGNRDIHGVIGT